MSQVFIHKAGEKGEGILTGCVRNRGRLRRACLVIALSMMPHFIYASASVAQARGEVRSFNVKEANVGDALIAFAEQAGLQLLFPYEFADETEVNSVIGQYTVDEALSLLLRETVFSGGLEEGGILVVSLKDTEERNREGKMASGKLKKGLLASAAALLFGAGANAQEVETIDEREETQRKEEEKDVIVVTGTTIRGVYPESQPLDIYTAEDIQLSGATTLNRFLETLPQNLNSLTAGAQNLGPGEGSPIGGAGIDLRGLGVGTTLILLNGRRLTAPGGQSPDVSLIPLGAVERVEVLTDGASAIYGSDAIAGVVNFIVREDFEGVDVSTSYGGSTRGGHDRAQADIAAGASWGSGSGFLSYSYSTQANLDAAERDFASNAISPLTLIPDERRHGVFGSINQDVTDRLSLFGNVFYATRDSEFESTSIFSFAETVIQGDQEQIFFSGGLDYEIRDNLFFQIDGAYLTYDQDAFFDNITLDSTTLQTEEGDSLDLLAKIDGDLFDLPGGNAKFSIGGGYSAQEFKSDALSLPDPIEFTFFDRDSFFAFAETFMPLIGESQSISGFNRLELSAAVRYTDYSDFGSAWTPRLGLLWSPIEGLNVRATYARAFRAPTLRELDPNTGIAFVFSSTAFGLPDTFSDDGSSIFLQWTGVKQDLTPEFSDTFTVGFDFEPSAVPNLRLSATYYNIDYTDRLGVPGDVALLLNDQEGFAFAFNPNPMLTDFEDVLASLLPGRFSDFTRSITDPTDPAAVADVVTVILDNRLDNLASSKSEGIDVSVDYTHNATFADINFGARLTKTLTSSQRSVSVSPEVTLLDTVGNPVSLKGSAYAGLRRGGFSSQINVQYIDSYTNTTVAPEQPIDSWTTVDLSLRYAFGENRDDLLGGAALSLSVQNLFDTDPPFVERQAIFGFDGLARSVGFDPVNANPLGRFITIGLTKQF